MDVFTPVLAHYRVYADGTESGSSPSANEDAAPTVAAQFGADSAIIHLRVLISNALAAGDGTASVCQLQAANGGAFQDVTATSSIVKAADSGSLTNDGATTNRATNGLTDPALAFQAGVVSEDGALSHQLGASSFTEYLYSIQIVGNDVANNDSLTFRVLNDGGTFTHNVTPTITVSQTNPTISAASMADGDRDWDTPSQDIAITFSESVDITPAPTLGDTVAGLTAQVNGGANAALTYVSGNATASWKVRRAELIQQDDTLVLDYAMASGIILAVDDEAELRETTDQTVTNNLTKRARVEVFDKDNALVTSTTVGYTFGDVSGAWSSAATDASGVLDVQYSGAEAVGSTADYIAVRSPESAPAQSQVWIFTVR